MSESASIVLLTVLLAAGIQLIVRRLTRLGIGARQLSYQGGHTHPWGLLDLLLALTLTFLCRVATELVLAGYFGFELGRELTAMSPGERLVWLLGGSVAALIALLATGGLLATRYGIFWLSMGMRRDRLVPELWLGVRVFLWVAPFVYTIQFLLAHWNKRTHPFVELLRDDPDPRLFGLIVLSAVVVAPITEEFLFRFLLQGWFERIAVAGEFNEPALWGGPDSAPDGTTGAPVGAPPLTTGRVLLTPIVLSSVVFSLFHLPHGPAPIPLFFFALALGYLYQRTRSLLPCLVLHALLNACSVALFGLYLLTEGGLGR